MKSFKRILGVSLVAAGVLYGGTVFAAVDTGGGADTGTGTGDTGDTGTTVTPPGVDGNCDTTNIGAGAENGGVCIYSSCVHSTDILASGKCFCEGVSSPVIKYNVRTGSSC